MDKGRRLQTVLEIGPRIAWAIVGVLIVYLLCQTAVRNRALYQAAANRNRVSRVAAAPRVRETHGGTAANRSAQIAEARSQAVVEAEVPPPEYPRKTSEKRHASSPPPASPISTKGARANPAPRTARARASVRSSTTAEGPTLNPARTSTKPDPRPPVRVHIEPRALAYPRREAGSPRVATRPAVKSVTRPEPLPATLTADRIVEEKAAEYVARGLSLAQRGATMAARAEFTHGLRHLAESYDQQTGTNAYTTALNQAFAAIREAQDFLGSSTGREMDVELLVSGHRSHAVSADEARGMSRAEARQRYLTFSQQRLAAASGMSSAGAQALYGMGKIEMTLADKSANADRTHTPTSVVLFQSALVSDPTHYLAANELGVVLGRCGQWAAARSAFAHSIRANPQAETWMNLATAEERLGRHELAQRARYEHQLAMRSRPAPTVSTPLASQVEWMDPQKFATTTDPSFAGMPAQAAAAPGAPPTTAPIQSANRSKGPPILAR